MTIGLVGKKQGMTRMFTPEGEAFAVSVVSVSPNTITQIKSEEADGYSSIQVTTGEKKEKHVKKPISGHYKKKGLNLGEGLWEFKVNQDQLETLEVGGQLFLEQFEEGQTIDCDYQKFLRKFRDDIYAELEFKNSLMSCNNN